MKPALLVLLVLIGGVGTYFSLAQKAEYEATIQKKTELRSENAARTDVHHETEQKRAAAEKERDQWLKSRSESQAEVAKQQDIFNELTSKQETIAKELTDKKAVYKQVEDELASYGVKDPQEVVTMMEDAKKKTEELNGALEEMNTLIEASGKKVAEKEMQLASLQKTQSHYKAKFATNSKEYRVTAVDPQWGFVVLNAGESSTLEPNTMLLVTRNGKNIARLKVTSKEKSQTVADIVPGSLSKGNRIEAGDSVFLLEPQS